MSKKLSGEVKCPCGSGRKYKNCCINKDFVWAKNDKGEVGRVMPMAEQMVEMLDKVRGAFVAEHGREPKTLFEGLGSPEYVRKVMLAARKKAGIHPALLYASDQCDGQLITADNERFIPTNEIAEWEAALDAYESQTGEKPPRRRLVMSDLVAINKAIPLVLEELGSDK